MHGRQINKRLLLAHLVLVLFIWNALQRSTRLVILVLTVFTSGAIMIRQGVSNDIMISTKQRVLIKDPYKKPFAVSSVLRCSVFIRLICYYAILFQVLFMTVFCVAYLYLILCNVISLLQIEKITCCTKVITDT